MGFRVSRSRQPSALRRRARLCLLSRKVDIRLPGKGNPNSHGARTVHQKYQWIRTSRLSIKNSLSPPSVRTTAPPRPQPPAPPAPPSAPDPCGVLCGAGCRLTVDMIPVLSQVAVHPKPQPKPQVANVLFEQSKDNLQRNLGLDPGLSAPLSILYPESSTLNPIP